ncbi:MAG: FKBP-type peptidyl-prolyl cis-trans isomerase [Candidatus Saccharibacteria bacterium]
MAKKRQRIAALIAALFFLIASLATSAAVIYTMIKQSKEGKTPVTDTTSQAAKPADKLAGFTPISEPVANLQITDSKVGTGDEAKSTSTVSVLYTGALVKTGIIFESSGSQPVSFPVSGVIKGWQDGVPGMKVGGVRRLVIPAVQAYGAQANAKIPANSDLVFDITLLSVK